LSSGLLLVLGASTTKKNIFHTSLGMSFGFFLMSREPEMVERRRIFDFKFWQL